MLFLALVLVAMLGTIPPPLLRQAPGWLGATVQFLGVDAISRSPLFVGLLAALVLNILLCTLHRVPPRLRGSDPARRRIAWLDAGMHLSLILVLVGGAGKALLGSVGTGYLFPDLPVTSFTDPLNGTVVPLGFGVVLRQRVEEYHPLRLRMAVRERATGRKLHQFELVEGTAGQAAAADSPIAARVLSTDGTTVLLALGQAEAEERVRLSLSPGAGSTAAFGPYELAVLAYRRDLRTVRGRVALLEGERVAREAWLEVNGGVSYRGTKFFLTAWGADQYGNQYLGIQYSRDPLAPVFWAGAVLFAVLLPLFLLLRHRRLPATMVRLKTALREG